MVNMMGGCVLLLCIFHGGGVLRDGGRCCGEACCVGLCVVQEGVLYKDVHTIHTRTINKQHPTIPQTHVLCCVTVMWAFDVPAA